MARRGRYEFSRKRKKRGGIVGWLLVLALLGFAGWLWWNEHGQSILKPKPQPQPPAQSIARSPATNTAVPVVQKSQPATQPAVSVTTQLVVQPATRATVPQTAPIAAAPGTFPRPVRDVLEMQVALARAAISSGSIDGVNGSQTRAALRAFQRKAGLPQTGELDSDTRAALVLQSSAFTTYTVSGDDLARLQPLSKTWLGKSQQSALEYETVLELLAEKGHASPNFIRRINPSVDWTNIMEGTEVKIPDVDYPAPGQKASFVVIRLSDKTLQAFDAETNLLAHFPCSIAARMEKRPVGELRVDVVAPNPNYTFDPEIFSESAEAREIGRKLILHPVTNNPVGVAWIGLDKPGYGMHGTPAPEQVGRTESHGCFRLANWNAEYLIKLVWVGMPVYVEP